MMQGSIRKRGNSWSYKIDIGYDSITGKRKQTTKSGFKSQKEASLALAQVILSLGQGTYVEKNDITFSEFANQWLEEYSSSIKKTTLLNKKYSIKKLEQYLAHYKLRNITKIIYQHVLTELKTKGLSTKLMKGTHHVAKQIFKKALEQGLLEKDPTEFFKMPREMKTVEQLEQEEIQHTYLEKEELLAFLEASKKSDFEQDYPLFLLLAYTGMRIGELGALKWSDIDFKNGTVNITKTLFNPHSKPDTYELTTPKTKKSKRKIMISSFVLKELELYQVKQETFKNHLSKQKMLNEELELNYHDENFVFTLSKYPGFPCHRFFINTRFSRILTLSQLPKRLSPHSLRHTHTSLLAEAGANISDIMDRLGHEDIHTTQSIYLHVTKSRKKQNIEKFAKLMNDQ